MSIRQIRKVESWTDVFKVARNLLEKEKLTVIVIASEKDFTANKACKFQTVGLYEYSPSLDPPELLNNLELLCPDIYWGAIKFQLVHERKEYLYEGRPIVGWVLTIIYITFYNDDEDLAAALN